jgi:hypothetical protein
VRGFSSIRAFHGFKEVSMAMSKKKGSTLGDILSANKVDKKKSMKYVIL